jgi:hypothetical protein
MFNGPAKGSDLADSFGGASIFGELGAGVGGASIGVEGSISTEQTGQPAEAYLGGCAGVGLGDFRAGLSGGVGGQYCWGSVGTCRGGKPDPDVQPVKPPHPPGGDHADDNASAAGNSAPSRLATSGSPVAPADRPRVGILWHGYAQEAAALLAALGWPGEPVPLDFDQCRSISTPPNWSFPSC